jgi:hypothetical protein
MSTVRIVCGVLWASIAIICAAGARRIGSALG